MNKAELIRETAERSGVSKKDAEEVLNAALEVITETLAAYEKVQLVGFGSFEVKRRAARVGRNPQNPGESIQIPESIVPVFRAGKLLRDAIS